MVYEQDGRRWIFFHDLFGLWQWALLDQAGVTVEQAKRSFRSYCSCMKDARTRGFQVRRAKSLRERGHAESAAIVRPAEEH